MYAVQALQTYSGGYHSLSARYETLRDAVRAMPTRFAPNGQPRFRVVELDAEGNVVFVRPSRRVAGER